MLAQLGKPIRIGETALRRVLASRTPPGTPEWRAALDAQADALRPTIGAVRKREDAAASASLTLDALDEHGIVGRDWLEAARAEEEAPFLYLPAHEAGS